MANTIIKLTSKFDLAIRIRKAELEGVKKMLDDNGIIFFVESSPFVGFTTYVVPSIGIRTAELIRQLLRNITVYD